jgi:hypothetical protein
MVQTWPNRVETSAVPSGPLRGTLNQISTCLEQSSHIRGHPTCDTPFTGGVHAQQLVEKNEGMGAHMGQVLRWQGDPQICHRIFHNQKMSKYAVFEHFFRFLVPGVVFFLQKLIMENSTAYLRVPLPSKHLSYMRSPRRSHSYFFPPSVAEHGPPLRTVCHRGGVPKYGSIGRDMSKFGSAYPLRLLKPLQKSRLDSAKFGPFRDRNPNLGFWKVSAAIAILPP